MFMCIISMLMSLRIGCIVTAMTLSELMSSHHSSIDLCTSVMQNSIRPEKSGGEMLWRGCDAGYTLK